MNSYKDKSTQVLFGKTFRILAVVIWPCVVSINHAETMNNSSNYEDALHAFEDVNRRFDQASSLQYDVERNTLSKGITLIEKWSFSCATQGLLRIDYWAPEKRTFVLDSKTFTEYLPTVRKALQTSVKGGASPAQQRVSAVLQRLSVDGLRVGDYKNLLNHLATVEVCSNQPAVLVIRGQNPEYCIRIDTQRQLLLSLEIWDKKGELVQSIKAGEFIEAKPHFWMPTKIETIVVEQDSVAKRETILSCIVVDAPVPKEKFDFKLPNDVEIQTN